MVAIRKDAKHDYIEHHLGYLIHLLRGNCIPEKSNVEYLATSIYRSDVQWKRVHGTRDVEKGKFKDEGGLLVTPRKVWEVIHSIHVEIVGHNRAGRDVSG